MPHFQAQLPSPTQRTRHPIPHPHVHSTLTPNPLTPGAQASRNGSAAARSRSRPSAFVATAPLIDACTAARPQGFTPARQAACAVRASERAAWTLRAAGMLPSKSKLRVGGGGCAARAGWRVYGVRCVRRPVGRAKGPVVVCRMRYRRMCRQMGAMNARTISKNGSGAESGRLRAVCVRVCV